MRDPLLLLGHGAQVQTTRAYVTVSVNTCHLIVGVNNEGLSAQ